MVDDGRRNSHQGCYQRSTKRNNTNPPALMGTSRRAGMRIDSGQISAFRPLLIRTQFNSYAKRPIPRAMKAG